MSIGNPAQGLPTDKPPNKSEAEKPVETTLTQSEKQKFGKEIMNEIRLRLKEDYDLKEYRDYTFPKDETPRLYITIQIQGASKITNTPRLIGRNQNLYSKVSGPISTFYKDDVTLVPDGVLSSFRLNLTKEMEFRRDNPGEVRKARIPKTEEPVEPEESNPEPEKKVRNELFINKEIMGDIYKETIDFLEKEMDLKIDVDYSMQPPTGSKLSFNFEIKNSKHPAFIRKSMDGELPIREYLRTHFGLNADLNAKPPYFNIRVSPHIQNPDTFIFLVSKEYDRRNALRPKSPETKEARYNIEILMRLYDKIVAELLDKVGLKIGIDNDYTMVEPTGDSLTLRFEPRPTLSKEKNKAAKDFLWANFTNHTDKPIFRMKITNHIRLEGGLIFNIKEEFYKQFDKMQEENNQNHD